MKVGAIKSLNKRKNVWKTDFSIFFFSLSKFYFIFILIFHSVEALMHEKQSVQLRINKNANGGKSARRRPPTGERQHHSKNNKTRKRKRKEAKPRVK